MAAVAVNRPSGELKSGPEERRTLLRRWWEVLITAVGPLVGVAVGALLARSGSRQAFIRESAIAEVTYRRQQYAAFQRSLWAFSSRVKAARDLAAQRDRLIAEGREPTTIVIRYDKTETKRRQEACRDAFADLTMFGSQEAQLSGRAAMEALTRSVNAVAAGEDGATSDTAFDDYEREFARFAKAVNDDLEYINAMMYAFATPLWRAILHQARRKPLPFEVAAAPSELNNPRPGPEDEQVTIATPRA